MGRTLLLANRLPYSVVMDDDNPQLKASVGGLATGLAPLLDNEALWIGWSGLKQPVTSEQWASIQDLFTAHHCKAIDIPPQHYEGFLSDVCNGVFWPLYHYQLGSLPVHMKGWESYVAVNRLFADAILEEAKPGDSVWVHDYHFQLVPQMLRDSMPDLKIGFFLHVPFPAYEVFRILPWRSEVMDGLLGADLIGFHTEAYCRHFLECCEQILHTENRPGQVQIGSRTIAVEAFPLGVDPQNLQSDDPNMSHLAMEIRTLKDAHPERRLLLSVDRMDYTKGLARKLLAYERLLDREPDYRGQLTFVQIAPPSRDDVPAYSIFRSQLDEIVGRINGKYGSPDYQPLQYLARPFLPQEIFQVYKEIDVMVVTPVRDGMNLVAKEFIAARDDEQGVLVLSELAGAASELFEALLVNPYDIEQVAQVMHEAIQMPDEDRMARMKALREKVLGFDTLTWGRQFLWRLHVAHGTGAFEMSSPESLAARIAASERPVRLFLDYDGTLVPIVQQPEMAVPDQGLRSLLKRLARHPSCEVHIVSGRPLANLQRWFPGLPVTLHAEHGAISSLNPEPELTAGEKDLLQNMERFLREHAAEFPGTRVEKKQRGLAFHFRGAPDGEQAGAMLLSRIAANWSHAAFHVLHGKKVIELRLLGPNKGSVVQRDNQSMLVAIGDDTTDEDMFAALPDDGIGIAVGSKTSSAKFRLRDSADVRAMLWQLDRLLSESKESLQ